MILYKKLYLFSLLATSVVTVTAAISQIQLAHCIAEEEDKIIVYENNYLKTGDINIKLIDKLVGKRTK